MSAAGQFLTDPERASGPSSKFTKTARRYRTIHIQAGTHVITAADLHAALIKVNNAGRGMH